MMKATSFFTPGGKYKSGALGGKVGSLDVKSFKDGAPGGGKPPGRQFKVSGSVTEKKNSGYPK